MNKKKKNNLHRIYGVNDNSGKQCVWIARIIQGKLHSPSCILQIKNAKGETKEIFGSECSIDY